MAEVSLLPASCSSCSLVQLVRAAPGPGQTPSCQECGGACSVLPGGSYAESDVPLFARIEASLRPTELRRGTIERVLAQLDNVAGRSESPHRVVLRVVDLLPPLHFLLPELALQSRPALDRTQLLRAAGMVVTIVGARLRRLEGQG